MAKHLAECHRKKHREFLQRMKTWKKVDNKKRINPLFSGAAHSDVPEIQAVPEKQPPQMNLAALDLYLGKPAATPNLTANPIGPEMQSENIPDRTETYIKISVTMTRWILDAYHRRVMGACEEDKSPENLSEALPPLEDRSNSPASPEMQEKIEKFKDLFPRYLKRAASSGLPFSRIGTAVPHRKFSQRKSEDGQRIIFERESCASRYVTIASLDKQTETFEVSRNGTIIKKMEVLPVRVKERDFKNEALPAPTEQYEAEADVPESSGRAAERPEIARKTESQAVPFDPLPSGLLFRRGPELRMHALGKRPPEYKPRKEKQELCKRSYEAQSQHCLLRPDVEKVIGGHPVCQFFDCYDGYRKEFINRLAARVVCKNCEWEKITEEVLPSTDVMAEHLQYWHQDIYGQYKHLEKFWKKVDTRKKVNPQLRGVVPLKNSRKSPAKSNPQGIDFQGLKRLMEERKKLANGHRDANREGAGDSAAVDTKNRINGATSSIRMKAEHFSDVEQERKAQAVQEHREKALAGPSPANKAVCSKPGTWSQSGKGSEKVKKS
ncbi:unnamed protein product, partial [Mesorhabditis spiculigera]